MSAAAGLSVRQKLRQALGLNPHVEIWYKRTGVRGKGREKRLQIAFAVNLTLVAVALPFAWNWRQQQLRDEWLSKKEKKEKLWVEAQREQERLAIQVLVNERRAARGLPPYPYEAKPVDAVRGDALDALDRVHAESRMQREAALAVASAQAVLATSSSMELR